MNHIRKLVDLDRQIRECEIARQQAEQVEYKLRSQFAELAVETFTTYPTQPGQTKISVDTPRYLSVDGKMYRVEYYHGVWKLAPIEITHIA